MDLRIIPQFDTIGDVWYNRYTCFDHATHIVYMHHNKLQSFIVIHVTGVNMATKSGNTINFVPTSEHYDACDKMCMNWSNYVHRLKTPDADGNTYYTDALTYKYLDHIVQNMRHPWIGTARIIDMTPARRDALRRMRGNIEPVRVPKRRAPTDPPFVYPKQYGTKLHDERSIRTMYCVTCGMDFYDHHDITTRVPIHCPWCESGHVSETDPWEFHDNAYIVDHIIRTRIATRGMELPDTDDDDVSNGGNVS